MSEPLRPTELRRLALIAAAGHAPGLALFASVRFQPALFRANVVAVTLTLLSMGAAFALAPQGEGGWWLLWAWAIGHAAWSVILSAWVLSGRGLTRRA